MGVYLLQADISDGEGMRGNDDEGLGGRILRARLALGARSGKPVTQAEIGKRIGKTGVTVGSWESGAKEPANVATLEKLAAALGVRASWLAFGEGAPTESGDDVLPRAALYHEQKLAPRPSSSSSSRRKSS